MGAIAEGVAIAIVPILLVQTGALLYWIGQISSTVRDHDDSIKDLRKKVWG